MAGNKKPRKAHKPRPHAIPVTIRHNAEDERSLQLIPHAELVKLRNGIADEESWHSITCRLNLGTVLANNHHPQEAIDAMQSSLDAMRSIARRHDKLDRFGATGDELTVIGRGLDLTDEMQMIATRRQLRDALRAVYSEGTREAA